MHIFKVTGIKDFAISDDGAEATFFLVTRFAGDLGVSIPIECLRELRLPDGPTAEPTQPERADHSDPGSVWPANEPATPPVEIASGGSVPAAPDPEPTSDAAPDPGSTNIRVSVPKTWQVTIEAEKHGHVIVLVDPRTARQAGYALKPPAAKQLASALLKQADAVLALKGQ